MGTFINGIKVESNTPHNLTCGDLIGVGCPENKSCREKGKETFVFKLHLSKTSYAIMNREEHFFKMKVYNTTCGMDFQALKHDIGKTFNHLNSLTVGQFVAKNIVININSNILLLPLLFLQNQDLFT